MKVGVIETNSVFNVDSLDGAESGKVVEDADHRNMAGIWNIF